MKARKPRGPSGVSFDLLDKKIEQYDKWFVKWKITHCATYFNIKIGNGYNCIKYCIFFHDKFHAHKDKFTAHNNKFYALHCKHCLSTFLLMAHF